MITKAYEMPVSEQYATPPPNFDFGFVGSAQLFRSDGFAVGSGRMGMAQVPEKVALRPAALAP